MCICYWLGYDLPCVQWMFMCYVYNFYYRLLYLLLSDLVLHLVLSLSSSNSMYACTV